MEQQDNLHQSTLSAETKETRKLDVTAFLIKVAKDLCDDEHSKLFQEIQEVLPTAIGLMSKLKLTEGMINPASPDAWEQGAKILALSKRWLDAKGDFVENRRVYKLITSLYEPEIFRCKLSKSTLYETDPLAGVIEEIVKLTWPESNGDIEWVRDHLAKDGMVMLPYKESEGADKVIQDQAYYALQVPADKRVYFDGMACVTEKVYFYFEGAGTPMIHEHEANHIRYPNLDIGALGVALNEGKTEELAYQSVHGDLPVINFATGSYHEELQFLQSLYKHDARLKQLLDTRYKNKTLQAERELTSVLMEDFGLTGYLDIYLASPYCPKNKNHIGKSILQHPKQIQERLGLAPESVIQQLLHRFRKHILAKLPQ